MIFERPTGLLSKCRAKQNNVEIKLRKETRWCFSWTGWS